MTPTRTLPPAEDADELAMDRAAIRFSVDLGPEEYRRLIAEQHRRRLTRMGNSSMRQILLEALRQFLPEVE